MSKTDFDFLLAWVGWWWRRCWKERETIGGHQKDFIWRRIEGSTLTWLWLHKGKSRMAKKGKRQVWRWRLEHDFAYPWPVCTKFSKKFYTSVHLQQTIIFLRNKLKTVTALYSFPFPVVVHLKRTWPRYVCMYHVQRKILNISGVEHPQRG